MKIDRVILASNENINYYPFWNPLSKVYKENFKIEPTLIWFGEESDIDRLGLSTEYGNIIVQTPHPNYKVGWQTTWSLFYYTKFFPGETITTMGIDQVPLSDIFLRQLVEDVTGTHSIRRAILARIGNSFECIDQNFKGFSPLKEVASLL